MQEVATFLLIPVLLIQQMLPLLGMLSIGVFGATMIYALNQITPKEKTLKQKIIYGANYILLGISALFFIFLFFSSVVVLMSGE